MRNGKTAISLKNKSGPEPVKGGKPAKARPDHPSFSPCAPVFIDLDDAYGLPFSSVRPPSLDEWQCRGLSFQR